MAFIGRVIGWSALSRSRLCYKIPLIRNLLPYDKRAGSAKQDPASPSRLGFSHVIARDVVVKHANSQRKGCEFDSSMCHF